jgi:hypothetical protein
MNALPDAYDYTELGALAPEPDEPDDPDNDDCLDCGRYYCTPDCRPRFVSPYLAARSRERVENGDPES